MILLSCAYRPEYRLYGNTEVLKYILLLHSVIKMDIMVTLEEAIKHCEEKIDNTLCVLEHRQLRDWLIELKEKREA